MIFRLMALLALGAAAVGVVLPVIPTVPFLLVAAWAGGKGWPALEQRLLAHPRCGPPIRDWRERGAVPRAAKFAATAMMATSVLVLWLTSRDPLWTAALAGLLLIVAIWLWRRPTP